MNTRRLGPWRRSLQIGLAAGMALVPWANAAGFHGISGNYLALDVLGLPLGDPLAALQVLVSARDIAGRAALGAGLALLLALVLGPVFCAWACPYGLFSEWVQGLARRAGRPRPRRPGPVWPKFAATGLGLGLIGLFGLPPLLNQLSLPALYSRLWQHAALGGVLLPVAALPLVLALEWTTGRRLWCRFLCPQSVLLQLARRVSPWVLRLRFAPGRCTCAKGQNRCLAACSLGLDPRRAGERDLACTNCGACRDACLDRGRALGFHLGPEPGKRTRQGKRPDCTIDDTP